MKKNMRTITEKAIGAFKADRAFRLGNTGVCVTDHYTTLYLRGNDIAQKDRETGGIQITTAGWDTVATKARLNGLSGVHVYTKVGQLYLNGIAWDGNWRTV